MRAINAYKEIQRIDERIDEIPYDVWTTFEGEYLKDNGISIMGDQVCLGGDYKSLNAVKNTLQWLTEQFGGKIEWENDNV